jgi:hypothetical protein
MKKFTQLVFFGAAMVVQRKYRAAVGAAREPQING